MGPTEIPFNTILGWALEFAISNGMGGLLRIDAYPDMISIDTDLVVSNNAFAGDLGSDSKNYFKYIRE